MKRLNAPACLALVIGALLMTGRASGATSDPDLLALERQRYDAMESVDIGALDELLADDLIFTHASGKIDNRKTFLASLSSGSLDYKSISTDDMEVRLYDSVAVVTGRSNLDINVRGEDRYLVLRFTSVWVRNPEGWQIVAYQSTRLP